MSDTKERVIKVVSEVLGVNPLMITPEKKFIEDFGAESIQSIELLAAFEEEFNIDMEEDASLAVRTVGGAIDFIENILNKE
jgi:acyl carrier protein